MQNRSTAMSADTGQSPARATNSASSAVNASDAAGKSLMECLAFTLGNEEYAIDILTVRELREYPIVTRIAKTPDFIQGVINLRGAIVPVIDMRLKFGLGQAANAQFSVVVILALGQRTIGMVVDGVSDVVTLRPDQIMPLPELGSAISAEYLLGIGTVNERMLILLDIARLMSASDIALLDGIAI